MSKVESTQSQRSDVQQLVPAEDAQTVQRTVPTEDTQIVEMFEDVLAYARERDYTGWDYGDGMSSRILQALPVDNKWMNIAFQETIKRFPVNVRPLFLVEQRRNYKGTALFAMANQTADQLGLDNQKSRYDVDYRREAYDLLNWLVDNQCDGYKGYCGGHQHRIQLLSGQGKPSQPDLVSTSFGVKALLRGGEIDERFPENAKTVPKFVMNHLNYRSVESECGAIVNYHLNESDDHYTINAGALCARMFVDLYDYYQDSTLRERAEALFDYIAAQIGRAHV